MLHTGRNLRSVIRSNCTISSDIMYGQLLTKSHTGTYTLSLIMAIFIQHLRLLLIIAIVLSPVQPVFAMQADNSMALSMSAVSAETATVSDITQSDAVKMLDNACNKQGKCSNCQDVNHCSSCPVSLGIPQILSKHTELSTQIQLTVSDVSLYSADLLPDYRPPRYS